MESALEQISLALSRSYYELGHLAREHEEARYAVVVATQEHKDALETFESCTRELNELQNLPDSPEVFNLIWEMELAVRAGNRAVQEAFLGISKAEKAFENAEWKLRKEHAENKRLFAKQEEIVSSSREMTA